MVPVSTWRPVFLAMASTAEAFKEQFSGGKVHVIVPIVQAQKAEHIEHRWCRTQEMLRKWCIMQVLHTVLLNTSGA